MFDYQLIDPDLIEMARQLDESMKDAGEEFFRNQLPVRDAWVMPVEGLENSNIYISRPDGSRMRVRVLKSSKSTKLGPAVLWMHGGGYASGIPEQSANICKRIVEDSGGIVVLPDYRLSVQAPFPAALVDGWRTLLWLKENAEKLGAREDQIMEGGESSGGGLCIALTLLARKNGKVKIAFQMPIYPMIDDRMITASSQSNEAPGWNTKFNKLGWRLYLGEKYSTDDISIYAAPARNTSFEDLPPAVTFVGDLDPFLDETISYFNKLSETGTLAECRVYKGCYHGFDLYNPEAPVSQKALDEFSVSFKYALKHFYQEQTN